MIRIIVCGGRDFTQQDVVNRALDKLHIEQRISLLIEGGAFGADACARMWAINRGVPYKTVPAEWNKYGNAAGTKRNVNMLRDNMPVDLVVAFPGGKGTAHMVSHAKEKNVLVLQV